MKPAEIETFNRLDDLLGGIESGGLRSLSSEDVLAFGSLYRRAVSALSTARSQGVDDAKIDYLNGLVARAYGHIYAVAEPNGWPSVATFFKSDFPRTFRKNLCFVVIAFVDLVVAAGFAYGVVSRDEGLADMMCMGPGASEMIGLAWPRVT